MITILSPIHVEAVGLANVRYFAPLDGAREFPWPSLDDIFTAMVLDRRMRCALKADLDGSDWAKHKRQIVTPDGHTTICQHFIGRGIIDALVAAGQCSANLYGAYGTGMVTAIATLLPDVHGDEILAYCRDAMQAGGGAS